MHIYSISPNGLAVDGSGKVTIPAAEVKANNFLEAHEKLSTYLRTKEPNDDVQILTPIELIDFDAHK